MEFSISKRRSGQHAKELKEQLKKEAKANEKVSRGGLKSKCWSLTPIASRLFAPPFAATTAR